MPTRTLLDTERAGGEARLYVGSLHYDLKEPDLRAIFGVVLHVVSCTGSGLCAC